MLSFFWHVLRHMLLQSSCGTRPASGTWGRTLACAPATTRRNCRPSTPRQTRVRCPPRPTARSKCARFVGEWKREIWCPLIMNFIRSSFQTYVGCSQDVVSTRCGSESANFTHHIFNRMGNPFLDVSFFYYYKIWVKLKIVWEFPSTISVCSTKATCFHISYKKLKNCYSLKI